MAQHLNRRPERALTAQLVKSLREPGKYFDGNGLYLRIESNGARFWVQRILIRGKRSEMGLGNASLVSLADARAAALENRKLARAGGDPLQARREALAVMTFEEAARKVHSLHLPTWRNAKHGRDFLTSLEAYAFPRLGKLKVPDVTSADVLGVLTPIWTEKAETARRVRQRIGTVMKWAIAQGWRKDNPAENIAQALPKADKTKARRKALPYVEVARCIAAVNGSGASHATKLALEFLILTAARSGEVRGAVWSEIDLAAKIWEVPAVRMKMKRPHRVPLSPRAVAILKDAVALRGDGNLVFPGTKPGKMLSDMTLSKLVKELGFNADVHGFRTSFRTWAQEHEPTDAETMQAMLACINHLRDLMFEGELRACYPFKRALVVIDPGHWLGDECVRQLLFGEVSDGWSLVPLLFPTGAIEAAFDTSQTARDAPAPSTGGRPRKADAALTAYEAIYPQAAAQTRR